MEVGLDVTNDEEKEPAEVPGFNNFTVRGKLANQTYDLTHYCSLFASSIYELILFKTKAIGLEP